MVEKDSSEDTDVAEEIKMPSHQCVRRIVRKEPEPNPGECAAKPPHPRCPKWEEKSMMIHEKGAKGNRKRPDVTAQVHGNKEIAREVLYETCRDNFDKRYEGILRWLRTFEDVAFVHI